MTELTIRVISTTKNFSLVVKKKRVVSSTCYLYYIYSKQLYLFWIYLVDKLIIEPLPFLILHSFHFPKNKFHYFLLLLLCDILHKQNQLQLYFWRKQLEWVHLYFLLIHDHIVLYYIVRLLPMKIKFHCLLILLDKATLWKSPQPIFEIINLSNPPPTIKFGSIFPIFW